jgi:hypothetical protein
MVELLLAGVIAAFVLGGITTSLSQIGKARSIVKTRYDAFLRADSALNALRRDVASVIRTDDLFYTRLLLIDDTFKVGKETFDRDELLVFNNRMRPVRAISYNGEGSEYETHFRVADDEDGPVLWQRRDAIPDEYPQGGGIATPLVEGIISLSIEAYDGLAWYNDWDSDIDGLPWAVRITITSSGNRNADDVYSELTPRAVLRTVVAIDRVLIPKDWFAEDEAEDEATEDGEEMVDENGNPIDGENPDGANPDGAGGAGGEDGEGRGGRPGRGGGRGGEGGGRGGGGEGPRPPQGIDVPDGGTVTGTGNGQPVYHPGGGG